MKRKLTQAIRDDIIDLSAHGRGQQDIATTVGMSQSTVSQVLRSYNKNEAEPTVIDARARAFLNQYRDLPAVPKRVLATKREDMGFDTPQEAIAIFSDLHYGSRIDRRATGGLAEYNIDLARERLANWRNSVLRLHQLNSLVIKIPRLNIFALGDDLEGHGAMFGSQALQMETNVLFQQMGFVEDMTQVILALTTRYPLISIYKVYGNHGRISAKAKEGYGPDNLEIFAWDQIASRVQLAMAKDGRESGVRTESRNGIIQVTGGIVDFHISPAFFIRVMIRGQEFVARHGHMIGGLQQTYTGAIGNKLALDSVFGKVIPYYLKAHLHEAQSAEPQIGGEIVQNGCFVGPSLLSVERNRASASLPSQEFYLVHPRKGLTHHHRIHLAAPEDIRNSEVIVDSQALLYDAPADEVNEAPIVDVS